MTRKSSIHDIARALHISATTISFVLNGKAEEKRISREMKEKIMAYVAEIGYQPNMVAKSLRTGKSHIIAMLVTDISDPFFSSITRTVEELAYKRDYKVFFASTENNTERTKSLIRLFRDRQVDGYIIAPPPGIGAELEELQASGVPLVLFDRYYPELNTHNVIIDNRQGTCDAVRHFIDNGYGNIGFVTLDSGQTQMADRLAGYKEAMAAAQLPPVIHKVAFDLDRGETNRQVKNFLAANTGLDAVLFATNYLAIGGLIGIRELGLSIPDDLAVIGFDDDTHFALFSPAITAIKQPVKSISENVVARLFAQLNAARKPVAPQTLMLPAQLIARRSSLSKVCY